MPTEYVRRTFTLTPREIEMLRELATYRHDDEERMESFTLRQVIREAHEQMQREKAKGAKR